MKNSGGNWVFALLVIIICIFACGVLAAGDFSHIGKVQPSQEVVDQNAIAATNAQIARDDKINKIITDFLDALSKLVFVAVVSLVTTGLIALAVFAVSKWIKRHDRNPDEAGRYPLVPSSAKLTNANTGLALNEPMPAEVMLKLAAMQRDVNMTWGAFSNGINGRQASDRQRDLRPAPPGWDGTIEMPEEDRPIGLEGFMLVDESGNQQQLSAGRGPEVAGVPATENMTWR